MTHSTRAPVATYHSGQQRLVAKAGTGFAHFNHAQRLVGNLYFSAKHEEESIALVADAEDGVALAPRLKRHDLIQLLHLMGVQPEQERVVPHVSAVRHQ